MRAKPWGHKAFLLTFMQGDQPIPYKTLTLPYIQTRMSINSMPMQNKLHLDFKQRKKVGRKSFACLLDPDKLSLNNVDDAIRLSIDAKVDYFFVGGSLIINLMLDELISNIKKQCDIPIILFPGSTNQISYRADALLFLSLISGRNADLLIGKHVETAPFLKISPLEIMSTGYMLIDGGVPTTVSYMSNTYPIPANKDDIAVCTAIAGEFLGLKLMYMDAGSGAKAPITDSMITKVSNAVECPLIVGGGIRTPELCHAKALAGADVVVVGDAIEKDPSLVMEMAAAVHSASATKDV
jgi:putative glycerol-1-phosphate prenyltransferase